MTERDQEFLPLYAVPPGETLEELLSDRQITQTELAMRMGRPLKTINEIVQGKAAITSDTAFQLERVLGVSASFWTDLERQYREDQDRVRLVRALERDASWLDSPKGSAQAWASARHERSPYARSLSAEVLRRRECAGLAEGLAPARRGFSPVSRLQSL